MPVKKPFSDGIRTRACITALLVAITSGGCSQSTPTATTQSPPPTPVDATEVSHYIQETIGWNKLSAKDQVAYTRLYNHELPDAERQAWYLDIVKHMSAATAGDSKLVLRPPGSNSVAKPKAPVVSPAEAKAYATAAEHIRQAWNKKIPISKLTKTELQWYNAISKKQLPKAMQDKWEAFLAPPKSAKGHKTMAFGVSGMSNQSK